MDPKEIPQRPSFWFTQKLDDKLQGRLFDQITIVFSLVLAAFSFIIFWPIISQINFTEAFFTPLAPFLINILVRFGFSANEALRVLFIMSFAVSTVGVYLLVRDLTRRQTTAILSAIIYLIPPIPVTVLTFLGQGSLELASAKSFFTVVYGDGAHFLALAMIPFSSLFFLRYLKTSGKGNFLATVITSSLTFLANRSQVLSLILILAVLGLSEFFLGNARVKIKRTLMVVIFALGLVSFWYTPSFLVESLLLYQVQAFENLKILFPFSLILGVLVLLFSFVFFGKKEARQGIFASILLFTVFFLITLDWLWHGRSYLPHPQRMIANLNMFWSIVAALTIANIIDRLRLVEELRFDSWFSPAKILGSIIFGIVSFLILSVGALTLSPLAVKLVGGPGGVWSKISQQVLDDRQHALLAAGENFKLVRETEVGWVGIATSISFLVVLVFLMVKEEEEE